MIKLWMDECQCASFFAQSAQTPVTAMRQSSTFEPVCCSTSERVSAGSSSQLMSLTAPQMRQMKCAWGSVPEIKAFQSVVDADGIDRALVLEHGEVSIDRRERQVRDGGA